MPLRQAFWPVSGSLLIVPIQQTFRFFAKVEPFSQLNNTCVGLRRVAIPDVGWNAIRRPDGHTETCISSPTHRTISSMFPCQLQSFNPFVQLASTNHNAPSWRSPG
jgi:hypothetical protein